MEGELAADGVLCFPGVTVRCGGEVVLTLWAAVINRGEDCSHE